MKPQEEWKPEPFNWTTFAKTATEVNEARKVAFRKTTGAFGGQSRSLRAAKTIAKLVASGIAKPVQS